MSDSHTIRRRRRSRRRFDRIQPPQDILASIRELKEARSTIVPDCDRTIRAGFIRNDDELSQ